ncbi:hypothetical protein [Pseudoalteromonas aliena]|uniref:hypothetical protein n=1 Tax=Pseudoalteromonas aliena TaxID=247523 RepID=UPI00249505A7|nr:hypothetical protein [Pseudoalteromonas aliena]
MFGLKSKNNETVSFYQLTLHIGRGTNTEMPEELLGAYVPVFVVAENHEVAAEKAVSKLVQQGYKFINIEGQIVQLDPLKWDAYVQEAWPEFQGHFPDQNKIIAGLKTENIFYGPFAGYDTPATNK